MASVKMSCVRYLLQIHLMLTFKVEGKSDIYKNHVRARVFYTIIVFFLEPTANTKKAAAAASNTTLAARTLTTCTRGRGSRITTRAQLKARLFNAAFAPGTPAAGPWPVLQPQRPSAPVAWRGPQTRKDGR